MISEIIYSILLPVYNEELAITSYRKLNEIMCPIEEIYEMLLERDSNSINFEGSWQ
jgi:hypothetical protein